MSTFNMWNVPWTCFSRTNYFTQFLVSKYERKHCMCKFKLHRHRIQITYFQGVRTVHINLLFLEHVI